MRGVTWVVVECLVNDVGRALRPGMAAGETPLNQLGEPPHIQAVQCTALQ